MSVIDRLQSARASILPPRGTGLITGTARLERGKGLPRGPLQRMARHESLYGQGAQSIIGEYKWWMRTRPSPDAQGATIEWVKNRPKVMR